MLRCLCGVSSVTAFDAVFGDDRKSPGLVWCELLNCPLLNCFNDFDAAAYYKDT